MTRVKGSELRVGMAIRVGFTGRALITAIRPYTIPSRVLHDYYAKQHPDGMSGFLVDTAPSHHGFTAFAEETYEVVS